MSIDSIMTEWHAAALDLASGVGVGAQAAPVCRCSSCQLEIWEGRVAFDSELGVLEMAPLFFCPTRRASCLA